MSKKILAVIRTSTIRQEIESQKKDIIDFCISKGFKEEDIVFVIGFGASARTRNDKYLKMLDEITLTIEKQKIKYVAVWHLNRLGRTEENLSYLKEYFERNHIQVYIKNPSLTLFNEDGSLNNGTSMAWTIFAMMIKFETIELMEKLSRGRQYRKEQKKYLGGVITYGYKVNENGFYEIDEEESKIVRLIFDLYSVGGYSAKYIVNELKERLILARNGKSFTKESVNQILRNEDYYDEKKYPVLITKEQFDKCRRISVTNIVVVSKERTVHLGSKLLKCLDCGCSFSVCYGSNGNTDSYLCNGSRLSKCKSDVRAIKVNVFDYCIKYVSLKMYSELQILKSKKDKDSIQLSIIDANNRLENVKLLIEDVDRKLSRLNRLYVDGKYTIEDDFENDYNKVIAEKNSLIFRKEELEKQIVLLNNQLELVSKSSSVNLSWSRFKNGLNDDDIQKWKIIVDLCISYAYLKRIEIEKKFYTVIVLVLKDEENSKQIFLWNSRSLFYPYSVKDVVRFRKIVLKDTVQYLDCDLVLSLDRYNEICK